MEFASGEPCTRATEKDLSCYAVPLIADATPHRISLTELTEPFFAVFRAKPAFACPIINDTSPSARGGTEQGIDHFDASMAAHGLLDVRPFPRVNCKTNPL